MKRFNFDEDDEHEDEEAFENQGFFSMAQFPIESEETLIDSSIKICENNIFWKFLSIDKKLEKIEKTYYFLQTIINEERKGE